MCFFATISPTECYKESNTAEPGDELIVVQTPFGKLGLAVCYDLRFSEIFIEFFKQGVEIIAVSAVFVEKTGLAHWHVLLRARAIEKNVKGNGNILLGKEGGHKATAPTPGQ